MIHVCFGLHDKSGNYSKFIGASMASIFANTAAPVTIHILHDATLTDDNRDKFSYLAGRYAQAVKFHNVDALCPDEINFIREKLADKIKSRFSIGAFYRLLIKKILGGGKAIYLDADTIANLDIAELWRHELGNFSVAAVPEVDATFNNIIEDKFLLKAGLVTKENYFCSGVMMFNLDALGENFFNAGVQFLVDNPKCESPDQDILNAFFAANYLKLEQKFDSFVPAERRVKNFVIQKKIYHFAGNCIDLNLDDNFNRLFLENFSRTPWLDVDALGNLGEAYRIMLDNYAILSQGLMKLAIEHSRAFFVAPGNLAVIKNLFNIQDDELIIENRGAESFKELLSAMEKYRGQKMFFICERHFSYISNFLTRRGFKEFEHFVNGLLFMSRAQSKFTHSEWNLIQAL